MSKSAKAAVIELASSHGCLVVADEVYQCLSYGEKPSPAMSYWLHSEHVLSVGSFSKILSPGLRLGWIETSQNLLDQLLSFGVLKSGGGFNPFVGSLVGHMLRQGWQTDYVEQLHDIFTQRVDVMDECLQSELGELVEYEKPTGGYFFWLRLKDGRDTESLLQSAATQKTGFRNGSRFSTMGGFKDHLRLSFAHYDEEAIRTGIKRLRHSIVSTL